MTISGAQQTNTYCTNGFIISEGQPRQIKVMKSQKRQHTIDITCPNNTAHFCVIEKSQKHTEPNFYF